MAEKRSARKEKAKGFVGGSALYQQRAAQALPLLVRQAKVHQPVFHKALADEMGMPFALNLNKMLGAIGYELIWENNGMQRFRPFNASSSTITPAFHQPWIRHFSRILCKDVRSTAIAAGFSRVRNARMPIASSTRSTSSPGSGRPPTPSPLQGENCPLGRLQRPYAMDSAHTLAPTSAGRVP